MDRVGAVFGKIMTLAVWFFSLTASLHAQPGAIASIRPEIIETGDTATLLIVVTGVNEMPGEPDFSRWIDLFPVENVIRRYAWQRSGAQWSRKFTLIAFDSARLELPPLAIRLKTGNPMETNALTLTVFPTPTVKELSAMAKIRDIRREPESWLDYWYYGAGALLLLGILYWYLRRKKPVAKPQVVAPAPVHVPALSPAEQALQRLSQLQQRQLWKSGEVKEHYAELSLILREYLEHRYKIAALESTTSEILNLLSATDFTASQKPELKTLLQMSDMVKYAQSQPAEAFHLEVLEKARALIVPQGNTMQSAPKTQSNEKQPVVKGNPKKYEPL